MKKILLIIVALTGVANAGPYYDLTMHTSSATMKVSGDLKVSASSSSANSPTIRLNGAAGSVTATSFIGSGAGLISIPYPITSTASLVAVDNAIILSTGVETAARIAADNTIILSTGSLLSLIDLKLSSPTASAPAGWVLTNNGASGPVWQPAPSAAGLTYIFVSTASDVTGYKQMVSAANYVPSTRSTTTVTITGVGQYISSRCTNVGFPGVTSYPDGQWSAYRKMLASNANRFKVKTEVYIRSAAGVEREYVENVLPSSDVTIATTETAYMFSGHGVSTNVLVTDRLCSKLKVTQASGAGSISIFEDGVGDNATNSRIEGPSVAASVANFVPYVGATQQLNTGAYGITMSSDVVARAYFGDGSKLTGIVAGGTNYATSSTTYSGQNTFVATTTFNRYMDIGRATNESRVKIFVNDVGTLTSGIFNVDAGHAYGSVYMANGIDGVAVNANGDPTDGGAFWTNGYSSGNFIQVYGGGKVGVGNATPKYKMDVTGGGHFTSSVTADAGFYGPSATFADGAKMDDAAGQTYLNWYSTAAPTLTMTGTTDNQNTIVHLVRVGPMVQMTIENITNKTKNASSGAIRLSAIPTEYRPPFNVNFIIYAITNGAVGNAYFEVLTDGTMGLYNNLSAADIPANQTNNRWLTATTLNWSIY